mmetsp:Transcript_64503/g.181468  ORF Transcript_64503/g.181468 Transcript_64503/m.181468 type:complete len:315 (+) Transcript_64503:293-1237(+)
MPLAHAPDRRRACTRRAAPDPEGCGPPRDQAGGMLLPGVLQHRRGVPPLRRHARAAVRHRRMLQLARPAERSDALPRGPPGVGGAAGHVRCARCARRDSHREPHFCHRRDQWGVRQRRRGALRRRDGQVGHPAADADPPRRPQRRTHRRQDLRGGGHGRHADLRHSGVPRHQANAMDRVSPIADAPPRGLRGFSEQASLRAWRLGRERDGHHGRALQRGHRVRVGECVGDADAAPRGGGGVLPGAHLRTGRERPARGAARHFRVDVRRRRELGDPRTDAVAAPRALASRHRRAPFRPGRRRRVQHVRLGGRLRP